jgi:inhibitor of cysteine peptidase
MEAPLFHKKSYILALLVAAALLLFSACTADTQGESSAKGGGAPAMVEGVEVETIDGHHYAIIKGYYPDPCTRISQVDQSVDSSRLTITLSTDSPDDLLCAQMLEAYEISILLETGGLAPGDYTVIVSEREATFSIGP